MSCADRTAGRRRAAIVLTLLVMTSGCQSGPESFPAVNDAMDCDEVQQVVDAALTRGRRFIAGQETDTVLADDLVFALSGAEERPECIDEDTRSRASGMRATIIGTTG